MLNIYQGFYQNIGPLKDKKILVNYKHKNVLIKAPIGTGKSFLFFDGPIFGLYKSSDRTIINKDSSKGQVQLIFSVDENYFLIIRKLTQTKAGKDSVKSSLYQIIADKAFFDYLDSFKNIVEHSNNDLLSLLKFHQVHFQDLTNEFKQETTLQQNLNDLLPPKEVALSTIFLPQSSDNIFEKKPAERITILKKVFGLLGIDDSKKIIDEEKSKVYGELKARENIDLYREKLIHIIEKFKTIKLNLVKIEELSDLLENFDILEIDKLSLDKLQLLNWDLEKYFEQLKQIQSDYVQLLAEKDNLQKNKLKIQENIKNLQNELKNIDQQISKYNEKAEENSKYQKTLDEINMKLNKIIEKYENLQQEYENQLKFKNEKINLEKEILALEKEKQQLVNQIKSIQNQLNQSNSAEIDKLNSSIKELNLRLEQLYAKIDFKKITFDNKQANNIQDLLNLIVEIESEGKYYASQIQDFQTNLTKLETNLTSLKQDFSVKEDFLCDRISAPCPFVDKILEKFDNSTKLIKQQKESLIKQIEEVKSKLNTVKQKRDKLAKWWKENNISEIKNTIKEIQNLEKQLQSLYEQQKAFQERQNYLAKLKGQLEEQNQNLTNLEQKIIEKQQQLKNLNDKLNEEIFNKYNEYQELLSKKEKITNLLANSTKELSNLVELKANRQKILENLNSYTDDLTKLNEKEEKITLKLENLVEKHNLAKQEEKALMQLKELLAMYNNLVNDYNQNKIEVQKIKKRYKILKDLSNIFGKELVIYVFSDYLKSLEELINYFISDIVNFSLHIQLDEKGENLDIFVEDNLGKRPVSSLSGGQKTALRIGWILAISKLQNNKMLFLDETINNFDQDSVSLLANKIREFVKAQQMKFYMITHSEILQQADIWDEVVNLNL